MRIQAIIATSALALVIAAPAYAGGYMKIPDIAGESVRAGHEGEIEISNVSYAIDAAGGAAIGAARARARANAGEFTVTKSIDAASPYIALSAFQSRAFPEIVIDMTKSSGGGELQYYTITLENARISSVDTSIDADGASEERVGLVYQTINIKYVGSSRGKAGGEHEIEYDVAAGR